MLTSAFPGRRALRLRATVSAWRALCSRQLAPFFTTLRAEAAGLTAGLHLFNPILSLSPIRLSPYIASLTLQDSQRPLLHTPPALPASVTPTN